MPELTHTVGYTNGIALGHWGSDTKSNLGAAIKLAGGAADGSQLAGLMFDIALQPGTIDGMVFVKTDLSRNENIYEQEFNPVDGQNIVWLDYAVGLDKVSEVYVGYSLTCKGKTIGYATQTTADGNNCSYVRCGSAAWTQLSASTGSGSALTLAAIMTGGDYSALDSTGAVVVEPRFAKVATAGVEQWLEVGVINTGVTTMRRFELTVDVNGTPAEVHSFDCELINRAVAKVCVPFELQPGPNKIEVAVTGSGEPQRFETTGYERTFPKRQLVETFTSQKCSNCPNGEAVLDRAIDDSKANPVRITHHAGFAADNYTLGISEQWAEMIGADSAPLMSLDRTADAGSSILFHPAYSTTAMFEPSLSNNNVLYGVVVDSATVYTSDLVVEAHITVAKDPTLTDLSGVTLHVAVIENGLIDSQNDMGTVHSQWTHNHTLRALATPLEGFSLDFGADGTVSRTLTTTIAIPAKSQPVDPRNLRVVAFCSQRSTAVGQVLNATEGQPAIVNATSLESIAGARAMVRVEGNVVTATTATALTINDLTGRLIATVTGHGSATLPAGVYLIKAAAGGQPPLKVAVR